MIKCDKDAVEIKGSVVDVTAEFSMIANVLEERLIDNGFSKEDADEKIKDSVRIGLLSDEEMREEVERAKKELAENFGELIGAVILGGLFK